MKVNIESVYQFRGLENLLRGSINRYNWTERNSYLQKSLLKKAMPNLNFLATLVNLKQGTGCHKKNYSTHMSQLHSDFNLWLMQK